MGAHPKFMEVSHAIEPGMVTYPGFPPPRSEIVLDYDTAHQRYENKAEFVVMMHSICGHTGTCVHAPLHSHRKSLDVAELPLHRVAHVPVALFDARHAGRAIGASVFGDIAIEGKAVLIRTDWSRRWGSERYFQPNPHLTADACEYLIRHGAFFVGVDSLNIDDIEQPARPAHAMLLGAGIPVCEHMTNLAAVPAEGGFLHATPLAWRGAASFPVRAYVVIP